VTEFLCSVTEHPLTASRLGGSIVAMVFQRAMFEDLERRILRPPLLLQIMIGPRQVGKTTAARALADRWKGPVHYAAADLPMPPGPEWIESQWRIARSVAGEGPPLLILDEVQKVRGWSEVVKALWDADRAARKSLRVLLLGSSALLLSQGMGESLAGRFFLHRCGHWTFAECQAAFGFDLDHWIYFGGYPGAAAFFEDPDAWRSYVNDSLIETVLARDVMAMQRITKPTLLRHLFALSARFPAQTLAYNKMLGQLHDAGNTTTLAHYLELLGSAFLVTGLERFAGTAGRTRGSSPKLILWNNALVSALSTLTFAQARAEGGWWGRLVENAVGAHLLQGLQSLPFEVTWWRDGHDEVDFVVRAGHDLWAIEVKSGRPDRAAGLAAFCKSHRGAIPVIVGSGGVELEAFFARPAAEFLRALR